jgi:hypothetical protein
VAIRPRLADVLQAGDDRAPRRRTGFCCGQGLPDHMEQHRKFTSVRPVSSVSEINLIVLLLIGS